MDDRLREIRYVVQEFVVCHFGDFVRSGDRKAPIDA